MDSSSPNRIKVKTTSVLFDLGNVLVKLDLERGLAHLKRLVGDRAPATLEVASVFFSEVSLACNRGEITSEQFLTTLRQALNAPEVPLNLLAEAWCDIFIPWPEMESLADEVIAAGHPTYLMSNTDPIHYGFLANRIPVLRRFTAINLSFESRFLKPDPRFFTDAISRYHLEPADCAYLDDRADHVESAMSVGIPSMVHRGDVEEARAFLQSRGVNI